MKLVDNECILYPPQYNYLWRCSFLSLIAASYALYRGHYDLALVPGGVFLTSINYWRKPDYSWRRTMDIVYVKSSLMYQNYIALNAEYGRIYIMLMLITICFYPVGIYFYKHEKYWHSTYAHSVLHIGGNLANVILYSGYIVPPKEEL
jgi:hypothetical protein